MMREAKRPLGRLAWTLALLASSGFVEAKPGDFGRGSAKWPADTISVGEQSHVCVTVHVDQRIWPRPLAPHSAQIFSGSLMAELRNLYERRGGSTSLPGRGRPDRFAINEDGDNAECQDRDTDVFVVARYGPRADGTAFVFDYRIARGAVTRAGRVEVDVASEIRAGRIRGFTQRRTMTQVIYEDLLARAPMLLDQLRAAQSASPEVEITKRGIVKLRPLSRICIKTYLEPRAVQTVAASGEILDDLWRVRFNGMTAQALADEFLRRRISSNEVGGKKRQRIISVEPSPECYDHPHNIIVKQNLIQGSSPNGYVVVLKATQDRNSIIWKIERKNTIKLDQHLRYGLSPELTYFPTKNDPLWDVYRDMTRLSRGFVRHLFEDPKK